MVSADTISLTVEDFTGQVRRRARGIPADATVGDLVAGLMHELRLPANDSQGRPLTYSARARGESLAQPHLRPHSGSFCSSVDRPEQRLRPR